MPENPFWAELDKAQQKSIDKKLDRILEVTIENLDQFVAGLPDTLEAEPYPPELDEQTYVRTLDLKFGWESDQTAPTTWEVTSDAGGSGDLYAGFVVGIEMQVEIHKGRWWFAEDVISDGFAGMFGQIGKKVVKTWEKPN